MLAPVADGLIVGSAIVRRLAEAANKPRETVLKDVGDYVATLVAATELNRHIFGMDDFVRFAGATVPSFRVRNCGFQFRAPRQPQQDWRRHDGRNQGDEHEHAEYALRNDVQLVADVDDDQFHQSACSS